MLSSAIARTLRSRSPVQAMPNPSRSRRTATRVTSGAISLSSSSHVPPMLYSFTLKPVIGVPSKEWGEGVTRDQDGELKESRVFIQLTDEQRGLLNELKAASARAAVSRVAPR